MRTGPPRPVRTFSIFASLAALTFSTAGFASPAAAVANPAVSLTTVGAKGVSEFYNSRDKRPLWLAGQGRQAVLLLDMLDNAELDGLNPADYRVGALRKAVMTASSSGNPKAIRRADLMLSEARSA